MSQAKNETKQATAEPTDQELAKLSVGELMEQLESIVDWFNDGEVEIDQATAKFDQGAKLAEVIRQRLAATENKINQIKLRLDDQQ